MPVYDIAAKKQQAREVAIAARKASQGEVEGSEEESIVLDDSASEVSSNDGEVEATTTAATAPAKKSALPTATNIEFNEPAQWVERMVLTSTRPLPLDLNADDDPKREEAFIQQTLLSVQRGISLLEAANVPWKRPDDYYAEMLKSDTHMNDVRQAMEASKARIEAQAHRRTMKDQKKYGKEVQAEVLRQRAKYKRDMQDRLSDWKKRRKGNGELRDLLNEDEDVGTGGKRSRTERTPKTRNLRPGGASKRPGKNSRRRR